MRSASVDLGMSPLADRALEAGYARHLGQRAEAASRAGSARGDVSQSTDALRNGFPVAIHAGHDHDAVVPPVVCRRENSAVPTGEDRAISGFVDVVEVRIAHRLPADSASDNVDNKESDPADEPSLEAILH